MNMLESIASRKLACVLLSCGSALAQCPQWLPGQGYATSAINGNVKAMTLWDPDGAGPSAPVLVASASFPVPGQSPIPVAAWNGVTWTAIGRCPVQHPQALAVYNGELIAGGFGNGTTFPSIVRWDSASWHVLGGDVDSGVRTMWVHGGDLFVGGEMTVAGGVSVNKIARWDGSQWHDVGGGVSGVFFPMVLSFGSFNGDLIVGGFFDIAGTTPASRIARWDGADWHALGAGRPGTVDAITEYNGQLIAGGSLVGDAVARWDGATWSPLGSGVNNAVRSLAVYGDDLVVGGFFSTAGGTNATRIARWDGLVWTPLTTGIANAAFGAGQVDVLTVFNGELIPGGFFDVAGGLPSVNFARWTDSGAAWFAQQPQPQTAAAGDTVILTAVPAAGYSDLAYQWRRKGTLLSNGPGGASPGGGTVAGASGTASGGNPVVLTISGVQLSDAGTYDLVMTHACASVATMPARITVTSVCYANCDNSTAIPVLTANDFQCFLNKFAAQDPYANCDHSTNPPTLNANDFQCFLNFFAAGCP